MNSSMLSSSPCIPCTGFYGCSTTLHPVTFLMFLVLFLSLFLLAACARSLPFITEHQKVCLHRIPQYVHAVWAEESLTWVVEAPGQHGSTKSCRQLSLFKINNQYF